MLTDAQTDGHRMPISHPATSRCDKNIQPVKILLYHSRCLTYTIAGPWDNFHIWKLTHGFIYRSHRCTLEWLSTHHCALTFFTLLANSADDDKLILSQKKTGFLFSGKNKKNISKCCMLNFVSADNLNIFVFFPRKQNLTFHANCLQMSNVYWKKINYHQYVVCWKCPEC